MTLHDLYKEGGFQALKRLGERAGANPQYLHQCATRWHGKEPSPTLARRFRAAEPRLTWDGLYPPLDEASPAPGIPPALPAPAQAEERAA